jgi:hypothetical protein
MTAGMRYRRSTKKAMHADREVVYEHEKLEDRVEKKSTRTHGRRLRKGVNE